MLGYVFDHETQTLTWDQFLSEQYGLNRQFNMIVRVEMITVDSARVMQYQPRKNIMTTYEIKPIAESALLRWLLENGLAPYGVTELQA